MDMYRNPLLSMELQRYPWYPQIFIDFHGYPWVQIRMFDEDELIGIEASYININNEQIKVFDVSMGWTWSEEDL